MKNAIKQLATAKAQLKSLNKQETALYKKQRAVQDLISDLQREVEKEKHKQRMLKCKNVPSALSLAIYDVRGYFPFHVYSDKRVDCQRYKPTSTFKRLIANKVSARTAYYLKKFGIQNASVEITKTQDARRDYKPALTIVVKLKHK